MANQKLEVVKRQEAMEVSIESQQDTDSIIRVAFCITNSVGKGIKF